MKRIITSIAAVAIACLAVALIPNQQPATAQQFVDLSSMETLSIDLASLEQRVSALEAIQCDCDQARQADVPATVTPIILQSLSEQLGIDSPALASPAWTWPGNIRSHLAADHGIDASEPLTNSEAIDLHNRLHNAESRGTSNVSFISSSDSCPGGVCPTGPGIVRGAAANVGSRFERQPVRSLFSRFRRR